jgi:hypothetical protein
VRAISDALSAVPVEPMPDERTEGLIEALDAAQSAWNDPAYVFGYGWGWTLNRKSAP